MGLELVLAIRLVAPLTALRWPLAGGVITIAADAIDVVIFQITDFPSIGYHRFDKLLDTYYLALFVIVAQRWSRVPRIASSALFAFRTIGIAAYEATGARVLLFAFPNVFELFFLFCAAVSRFRPYYEWTPRRAIAWIAVLLVPKMAQEYALHYAKWLDNLSAAEIIEDTARAILSWLRDRVT